MSIELVNKVLSLPLNSELGILLYWVPASLCAFGYTVRTFANYQRDVSKRAEVALISEDPSSRESRYYSPTDTIGALVGRAIVTIIPVANLWAATFDVAPSLFGRFFSYLGRVLNQPLVPSNSRG